MIYVKYLRFVDDLTALKLTYRFETWYFIIKDFVNKNKEQVRTTLKSTCLHPEHVKL